MNPEYVAILKSISHVRGKVIYMSLYLPKITLFQVFAISMLSSLSAE